MSRVLLVEDEEAVTFALSKILRAGGLEVSVAGDLETSLSLLDASESFDVVVTDLRLGGVGRPEGVEVVKRAHQRRPDTRIIVITAFGTDEVREEVLASGAELYLEKPVSPRKIRSIILGWLGDGDGTPAGH